MLQECMKAFSTGRAKGILCGVMNYKNLIFAEAGSMKTCSLRKVLNFSSFKISFWDILHQMGVIITHLVPNTTGNYIYKLCVNACWDVVKFL